MRKFLFTLLAGFLIIGNAVGQVTYCTGGPSSAADSEISSVILNGQTLNINYQQICPGTVGVNNQRANHTADVVIGNTYTTTVGFGSCGGNFTSMGSAYIDWNGNGTFEPSEAIGSSPAALPPFSGNYAFTVPPSAVPGTTVMRVLQWETSGQPLPLNPCATMTWGSMIDFTIQIVAPGPCTIANADTAVSNKGVACVGDSAQLSATNVSFGNNITYQWQSSVDNVTFTNIAGANTVNYNTGALTTTAFYRLSVTCGTVTDFSTSVRVEVIGTPLAGGTYTVNSAVPTGGTNFQTFADFTGAIFCGGISGPVVLNVVPGSGPYNEQVIWTNINTSTVNTITVNGNGNTLTFAAPTNTQRGIFILENTSNVTIDSLVIVAAAGFPTAGYGIQLLGNSNNNIIRNCLINFDLGLTGFNTAGIHLGGNPTSATAGTAAKANNVVIENNTINGSYYGIVLLGNSNTDRAVFNRIENNNIHDFHFYGIYSRNQNGLQILNNDIARPLRTTLSSFYGIFLTGEHESVTIERNAIHDAFTGGRNTSLIYAVYMTGASGTVGSPNFMYNNILYNLQNNGTLYGIWNAGSSHWKYYHNTVDVYDTAATITSTFNATRGVYFSGTSDGVEFINNVVSVVRTGASPKHAIWVDGTGTRSINRNGYWIDLTRTPAEFGNGAPTFAAWAGGTNGFDAASVYDFPDFVSAPTGLLRPRSGAMNDLGQNLLTIVPKDYLDSNRTITPDPGAFEFSPPACPRPSVNLVGASDTSATVFWTSGIAGGTYNIEWGPQGFTRGTGNMVTMTGDTLSLNGLPNGTCYDIYVQLDCSLNGNGFSPWSFVYTFCTEVCDTANSCPYVFRMTDSFGDGWNGNTMDIRQGGVTVATIGNSFTTGNGPIDVSVNLCAGAFELFWNPGGSWANEVGVEIIDPFNTSLFSMPANSATLQNTVLFTGLALCGPINCLPPTQFAVTGTSDTSATFTWTLGGGTTTVIEYGPVGFTQGMGTQVVVGTPPATITGLTPNTPYEAYIIDTCIGNAASPAIGPRPFRTACQPAAMPYQENYLTWPVPCWTNTSIGGNMLWQHYTTGGVAHAEARFWTFPAGNQTVMTTVPILISTDAQVRYNWGRQASTFYTDSLFVLARILGSPTWDTLKAFGDPNFGGPAGGPTAPPPLADFTDETHFLPSSYVGQAAEIRFHAKSDWGPNVYMDYFIVEAQPPCPDPNTLTSSNVTPTSVSLNWNQPNAAINTWQIEWGPVGFTPGTGNGTIVPATTNPFTLSGLTPGACIDIYVRANCTASGNGFSTGWAGPIQECLPFANDIEMEAMVNPAYPVACGDSAMLVRAVIRNNGLNPASSIPLRMNMSGGITQTLNATYPGPLAPGARDTVVLGTVNTFAGGLVDVDLINLWTADQNSGNDTLAQDSLVIAPGLPVVNSGFACANDDSLTLSVNNPINGLTYNWFTQAVGGNPVASGNSITFPLPSTANYFVEYAAGSNNAGGDSLDFTFAAGNGSNGNMFDINALTAMNVLGFTVSPQSTGPVTVEIYHRTGSYVGFENAAAGWTLIQTETFTANATPYRVSFANPLAINPGTHAFYVTSTVTTLNYTNGTVVGAVLNSNADLQVFEGVGKSYPFGATFTPRNFNGRIIYSTGSGGACTSPRIPVPYTNYTDTAVASFTATEVAGGQFNFDATASVGHLFNWTFGDGATGNGRTTSHTYGNPGPFSVTLTVTDTICNSTDVLTQIINSTISAEEFLINQRLVVYPNPSRDVFNLEFEMGDVKNLYIRVVSPTGQLITENHFDKVGQVYRQEIDLGAFAKGVYILQVQTERGIVTRRLTLL